MIIQHATIVNEGERFVGAVQIKDGFIERIDRGGEICDDDEETIDAEGAFLLPGVIDDHVHMREPGMTHKADMESETRAAAAGGVTSVLDMPNVVPQTVTIPLLKERYDRAATQCHVNYGFYLGATNDNLQEIVRVDPTLVPGVKIFMGSSTGNMLVDKVEQLERIFAQCPTLLMAHCEDTLRINQRMAETEALHGADPDVQYHPLIRDEEACFRSTQLAVELAERNRARLHVAHVTTARELTLFRPNDERITAEACIAHLLYTDEDYKRLGTRIKCNPAIKTAHDRQALRQALNNGLIRVIGTDHAPHLLEEKQGGCRRAVSGMPMVQFSLPSMLEMTDEGVLSMERMVQLMCHNPAQLFKIHQRGFLREGFRADMVLVRKGAPWRVDKEHIESKCGWSPREGDWLNWRIEKTWVNGLLAWDGTHVIPSVRGQQLIFNQENG